MPYEEILYSIWLSGRYPPGSTVPGRLYSVFKTARKIYEADERALLDSGFKKGEIKPLTAKSLDYAEKTALTCAKKSIAVIACTESAYPSQLRDIDSPPPVIYCRGRLPSFESNLFISAVGTRKISDGGKSGAHRLCFDIASAGAVVISGMARGADTACHAGALDGGGITIAAVGTGLDVVYPPENEYLYGKILESGGAISEYPPGTEPNASNFPVRNRLIAALGSSVIIVEAGLGSGALITADYASRYNRPLYAVPGQINTPTCKGTNLLIKQGVKICTCAEDVLYEYELTYPDKIKLARIPQAKYFISDYSGKSITDGDGKADFGISAQADAVISRASELTGTNRIIYEKLLRRGSMAPEELADGELTSDEAVYRLTLLNIAGFVTMLPGGKYVIK